MDDVLGSSYMIMLLKKKVAQKSASYKPIVQEIMGVEVRALMAAATLQCKNLDDIEKLGRSDPLSGNPAGENTRQSVVDEPSTK